MGPCFAKEEMSPWGSIDEILDRQLYLSGMQPARNPSMLRSKGITHVLCVAGEAYFGHPLQGVEDILLSNFDGMLLDDFGHSPLKAILPPHIDFIDRALAEGGRC